MRLLLDFVKILYRLIPPPRYSNVHLAIHTILYTRKSVTWPETHIIGESKQREQA